MERKQRAHGIICLVIYIGEYQFQGRTYTNVYPAIVSKELFEAVQKQLPKRDFKLYTLQGVPTRKHPRSLLKNPLLTAGLAL